MKKTPARIKKTTTAALLAALLFFATGARAEVVDRIVAIINESIITMSELNAATAMALEKMEPEEQKEAKKGEGLKKQILENLIQQKLVKQASDKAGIDISEREIDNAVDDIKRQNNMDQEKLLIALAQNGLTLREYREQLKEQIRQVKFISKEFRSKISIQGEDVEDYYRTHKDEFWGPASYRLNLIFLSSGPSQAVKMKSVKDGLAKGDDFRELASHYSDGSAASLGGDMGYLRSGEMDRNIEVAASKLKPGSISAPVATSDGVYFIQLIDYKAPELKPLDAVKAQITDKLFKKTMDERFSYWLAETKKTAHVEIRL